MKKEFVDGIVALKLPDLSEPGILPFPVQPVMRTFTGRNQGIDWKLHCK
jgi:hypothetical protein